MRGALACTVCAAALVLAPMHPATAQNANDLQRLTAAQQAAMDGSDSSAILQTSRALAELATQLLVALAEKNHNPETTLELQRQMVFANVQPGSAAALVTAELKAGERAGAMEDAEAAVDALGNSAQLRTTLAAAMHAGDDLNGTVEQLRRAEELAPDAGMVHLALGEALWELNEQQYGAGALAEVQRAEQLEPGSFAAQYKLGVLLAQYHRYPEAELHLRRAASLDAASPDPYLQLGVAEYQQNKTDAARKDLERCVQLTGADDARNGFAVRLAYAALSRIYENAGLEDRAAQALGHVQELHARAVQDGVAPELSESTAAPMGTAIPPTAIAGRGPGAKPLADAASTADAKSGPAMADVSAVLRTVVARSANDAGTTLAREHEYARALAYFRWAAQADPRFDPVERNLGIAALRSGLYGEAVEALNRALLLHPEDALAARDLAEAQAGVRGAR